MANARWLADALLVLGEDGRASEVLHHGLEIVTSFPQVLSEIRLRARLAGLGTTDRAEASRTSPSARACWPVTSPWRAGG